MRARSFLPLAGLALAACIPEIPPAGGGGGPSTGNFPPFQEIYEAGLLRYVGDPAMEPYEVDEPVLYADLQVHRFDPDLGGPICMRGDEFYVETREGESDDLLIFLQGGGVCMTEVCIATSTPILTLQAFTTANLVGVGGVLDRGHAQNPFADWDVVHAPYCDGSIFTGDVDRELQGDMAYQRGLQNLTATLEVAKAKFPNPPRITLIGMSGGAYGVVAGTALLRHFYPDTPLTVVSDSGAPTLTSAEPGFLRSAMEQFNALDYVPASCGPDCIADGHLTRLLLWALARDPNLTVAYMSHARDSIIGVTYLGNTADGFEADVLEQSQRLVDTYPGRAFRYITSGATHTFVVGWGFAMTNTHVDESGGEVNGYQWLDGLVNDPGSLSNVVELD